MSIPRRQNDHAQEFFEFSMDMAQITGSTTFRPGWVAKRDFRIDSCDVVNPTGLAIDTSNYYALALKNGSKSPATLSTHDTALTAGTTTALALSSTDSDLTGSTGDELTFVATKTGTQTLPAGRFRVTGRYV